MRHPMKALALVCLLLSSAAMGADNPIFDELTTRGVSLGEAELLLPQPWMPDGLTAQQQKEHLAKLADETHPLSTMMRNSVVAPQVLAIKDEPTKGEVRPRRVDVWFIAYGNIDKLSDEDFLRQQAA